MIPTWQDTWLLIKLPSGASKKQTKLVVNGGSSHTVHCNSHKQKGSRRKQEKMVIAVTEWSSNIPLSQWHEHQKKEKKPSKSSFPESQDKSETYNSFLSSHFCRSKSLWKTANLQCQGLKTGHSNSPHYSLFHACNTQTFPHLESALQPSVTSGILPHNSLALWALGQTQTGEVSHLLDSLQGCCPSPALLQHWCLPDHPAPTMGCQHQSSPLLLPAMPGQGYPFFFLYPKI